jgi:hypothetical protein
MSWIGFHTFFSDCSHQDDTVRKPFPLSRFGKCEVYKGGSYCDTALTPQKDYVFSAASFGSQNDILYFLQDEFPRNYLGRVTFGDNRNCYENMLRIICNYYLSPCGNETVKRVPTPICPDECLAVQNNCSTAWKAASNALKTRQCISCDAYSYPLSNCCVSIGLILNDYDYYGGMRLQTNMLCIIIINRHAGGSAVLAFLLVLLLPLCVACCATICAVVSACFWMKRKTPRHRDLRRR